MSADRDLFGHSSPPAKVLRPNELVAIGLYVDSKRSTDRAWFLTKPGQREGRHVARSLAVRGTGPNINTWSLPRWLAAQNGWL